MSRAYWVSPLAPLHILDGAAFTTFTAFQDISPAPAIIVPANLFEPGTEIRLDAWGQFSNTGTPTLGLGFFWGTAAVPLAVGTASTTTTAAIAWPWHAEWRGRVRTVGSTGTIYGQGAWELGNALTGFASRQAMPATAAARTVTIDTTVAKVIGVGAVWGTSSASNSITCNQFSVEIIS